MADPLPTTEHEHALHALIELGRELTTSIDAYDAVDLVLLSVMGQMGTPCAAVWLLPDPAPGEPVLVGCHGFSRAALVHVGTSCVPSLAERFQADPTPLSAAEATEILSGHESAFLKEAGIALLAPLWVRGSSFGAVAVGERPDRAPYRPLEIQAFQASLAIASLSLHTGSIVNRLLESGRRLHIANEDLRYLDRLKSEFLSNVNHELRTPLAVILANLECVLELPDDYPNTRGMIRVSLEEGKRLQALVEGVLTLSDISQDELSLTLAEGDVGAYVAWYHAERHPGVTAGLRHLQLERREGLPMARFDERRVRQILDALVDNAVKFTPPGTTIVLRVSAEQREGGDWVRVDVSDDGPGVPEARMPTLFQSFRQIDGSSTRRRGGLGIGLALARQLAVAMGGTLDADPSSIPGATFRLFLPSVGPGLRRR